MHKIVCYFLCFILATLNLGVPVFAQDATPSVDATAAILMDAKTGRVLWEKNANQPMAMASTTKIMTSVMVLESGRGNEIVTASKKAAAAPKMKMHLQAGEKFKLNDLLFALMLESNNDAAVAIAEHLGGSVSEFCALMTQKAKEIGAKDTVFETASGLDAGDHHSTAYDLAVITRYALEVPGFIELTNTANTHFSSDKRSYSMVNKNRLLQEYPGANGVKTGFTNKAGHCFVGAAKRDDMQLISVVLASGWGDKGRKMKWVDTKEVLDYGFANYIYKTVITEENLAGAVAVTRSRTAEVGYVYDDSLTIPLNKTADEQVEVKIKIPQAIQAPVAKGEIIGHAVVMVNGQPYADIALTATDAVIRHDLKTSLEKVLNQWLNQVLKESVSLVLPEFAS